jgi:hypothetical protein
MPQSTTATRHFSPRVSLAAIGLKLQQLNFLQTLGLMVRIPQKTIKHYPAEKLFDAFIAILAGLHGLNEINSRLRSDPAQRAFGRHTCAEYSLIQDTLDACTPENVEELQLAINILFRSHSQAIRHDYKRALQLIDIDMSGLPCGQKAELSCKGYFSKAGVHTGRQLGRVIASHYEEIVVDHVFAGNVQLNTALRPLVEDAEHVLQLDYKLRQRTLLRMDAGGGNLNDLNWLLMHGYQLR